MPKNRLEKLLFELGDVSFKMVRVQGGTFKFGLSKRFSTDCHVGDDCPEVTLSSFFIGETAVTQALWTEVMKNNPSCFVGKNKPVEMVNWYDCLDFIYYLNFLLRHQLEEGKRFRMPTEAEWEFAAAGGVLTHGFYYSGGDNLDQVAWHWRNSGDKYLDKKSYRPPQDLSGFEPFDPFPAPESEVSYDWILHQNNCQTHPVKKKRPNELGLYDMSGNVCEWCSNFYLSHYAGSLGTPDEYYFGGATPVCRGGSWCREAVDQCRITQRCHMHPEVLGNFLGLRLVLAEDE